MLCVADTEFKRKVSFPLQNISTYLTPYDQTIGKNPNDGGNRSNSDNRQVKFKVSKTKSPRLAARILSVTFNELPHVVRMRTLQCQTLLNNFLFAICLKQKRIAMNEANEKIPECH